MSNFSIIKRLIEKNNQRINTDRALTTGDVNVIGNMETNEFNSFGHDSSTITTNGGVTYSAVDTVVQTATTDPVTINSYAGNIRTVADDIISKGNTTVLVNNDKVTADSIIMVSVSNFNGLLNNVPVVNVVPDEGSFTLYITNAGIVDITALSVEVSFLILN